MNKRTEARIDAEWYLSRPHRIGKAINLITVMEAIDVGEVGAALSFASIKGAVRAAARTCGRSIVATTSTYGSDDEVIQPQTRPGSCFSSRRTWSAVTRAAEQAAYCAAVDAGTAGE